MVTRGRSGVERERGAGGDTRTGTKRTKLAATSKLPTAWVRESKTWPLDLPPWTFPATLQGTVSGEQREQLSQQIQGGLKDRQRRRLFKELLCTGERTGGLPTKWHCSEMASGPLLPTQGLMVSPREPQGLCTTLNPIRKQCFLPVGAEQKCILPTWIASICAGWRPSIRKKHRQAVRIEPVDRPPVFSRIRPPQRSSPIVETCHDLRWPWHSPKQVTRLWWKSISVSGQATQDGSGKRDRIGQQ